MVDPWLPTQNRRAGPDYRPWDAEVQFACPEDKGDFAVAADRWRSDAVHDHCNHRSFLGLDARVDLLRWASEA